MHLCGRHVKSMQKFWLWEKTGKELLVQNVYSNSDGACLIGWFWGLNDTACFFSSMISSTWKIIAAMLINITMLQGFGFWFLKREYKKRKNTGDMGFVCQVHVQRSEDNFSAVSSLISPYFEAEFIFVFIIIVLFWFALIFFCCCCCLFLRQNFSV